MPDARVYRPLNLKEEVRIICEKRRTAVERAIEALLLPKPDTFLGRQHYDFVPLAENVVRAGTKAVDGKVTAFGSYKAA